MNSWQGKSARIAIVVCLVALVASSCIIIAPPGTTEDDLYPHSYWDVDVEDYRFEMIGLGYNDYVDGAYCAYLYDFRNLTDKTISKIRTVTHTLNRYTDPSSMVYTYSIYVTIPPQSIEHDLWIYLGDYRIFYSKHAVEEVTIWYSDGSEYAWVNPNERRTY